MTAPEWTARALAEALGQFPPTSEQARVIEAPLEPMLVIAGAGSGKTETMAAKVVYLVANGLVKPEEILGLTFTRKAAAELSERIRMRLRTIAEADDQVDPTTPPRISTYNSYAAGIVGDHGLRLGVDPQSALISEAGRFQLAEQVVNTWGGDLEADLAASTLTSAVAALAGEVSEHGLTTARIRNFLTATIAEIESKAPQGRSKKPRAEIAGYLQRMADRVELMDLVDAFAAAKRERGVVDFGDQVRFAADLAMRVPAVAQVERATYKVVLLDEYQDTSIAQVQLLSALFGGEGAHPVTAVGDPNQAIYGWRGAAAGTLLDFPSQFRADGAPARTETLSVAWRNAAGILSVANKVAAPLRGPDSPVPELTPREGAPPGQVEAFYGQTVQDEADGIVSRLREAGWPGEHPPTTAVLVRARKSFPPIIHALEEAGIPHQVSGLGGLLSTPEVTDLRAALTVVHDPSRSDALMRLLTGPTCRIGPTDLHVLSSWAKELARQRSPRPAETAPAHTGDGAPAHPPEDAEAASIVEALAYLPPAHYAPGRAKVPLSAPARERLTRLSTHLSRIRDAGHLPLPDLVVTAEHALGLDIDVLAYRTGPHARDNLDAFAQVASSFTSGVEAGDLGGFLTWLEAAEEHERGLDLTETEPDPCAVQLMTIHAAKGLEWDVVVVAGMGEGLFPSLAANKDGVRRSSGWLRDVRLLPYDLRGDAVNLPSFDHEQALTHADMKDVGEAFRREEGQRVLQEERRLAYVALTRAKTRLLLTGSFWTAGRAGMYTPSTFLTEATRAGVPMSQVPHAPDSPVNPHTDEEPPVPWPPPLPVAKGRAPAGTPEPGTPEAVTPGEAEPGPAGAGQDPTVEHWHHLARLLLAEREARDHRAPTAVEHLSASRVVAAARDPQEFSRNLRRPVPQRPSERARAGTEFHSWVEQHFNAPALVDLYSLPGAEEEPQESMDDLIPTFRRSPWATRSPVAVEADVETTVAGIRIRSRIDAVFAGEGGGYEVVDWKTGHPPRGEEEEHVRMVQLQLYRLAWARSKGISPRQVRALFYYVPADLTIEAPDLDEQEITDLISAHLGRIGQ